MNVKVRTFANLRDVLGKSEIAYEMEQGNTLGCLLQHMSQTYGKSFDHQIRNPLTGTIIPLLILINGKVFRSVTDLDTPLNEGDVITIMLPFDGG